MHSRALRHDGGVQAPDARNIFYEQRAFSPREREKKGRIGVSP
jgi:hypothetical protein